MKERNMEKMMEKERTGKNNSKTLKIKEEMKMRMKVNRRRKVENGKGGEQKQERS